MTRILLADDDTELCEMLQEYLEAEGFEVEVAHDGDDALSQVGTGRADLIVLDVMMPRRNGLDVLRELRPTSLIPVLMLTARGDDIDSIVGLELGADDYLAKPCNPRVLVARIRALLRRTVPPADGAALDGPPDHLAVDDLEMHTGTRRVAVAGEPVALTSTEFSVLEVLLRAAGHVVSKADLSEHALGRPLERYDRSIDMHMSSLRKKLGRRPDGTARITTVRGIGYQYTLT
jgi:two-component system response regulator CpxR